MRPAPPYDLGSVYHRATSSRMSFGHEVGSQTVERPGPLVGGHATSPRVQHINNGRQRQRDQSSDQGCEWSPETRGVSIGSQTSRGVRSRPDWRPSRSSSAMSTPSRSNRFVCNFRERGIGCHYARGKTRSSSRQQFGGSPASSDASDLAVCEPGRAQGISVRQSFVKGPRTLNAAPRS